MNKEGKGKKTRSVEYLFKRRITDMNNAFYSYKTIKISLDYYWMF